MAEPHRFREVMNYSFVGTVVLPESLYLTGALILGLCDYRIHPYWNRRIPDVWKRR